MYRIVLVLIIIFLFVASIVYAQFASESILSEARTLDCSGNQQQALEKYDLLINNYGLTGHAREAEFYKARIEAIQAISEGLIEQADVIIREVEDEYSDIGDYSYFLYSVACKFDEKGLNEKAHPLYEKTINSTQDKKLHRSSFIKKSRIEILWDIDKGDIAEANELVYAVIAQYPDHNDTKYMVYKAASKYDEVREGPMAEELYRYLYENYPDYYCTRSAKIKYARLHILNLINEGQIDQAIAEIDKIMAIEYCPKDVHWCVYRVAERLDHAGQTAKAKQLYEFCIQSSLDDNIQRTAQLKSETTAVLLLIEEGDFETAQQVLFDAADAAADNSNVPWCLFRAATEFMMAAAPEQAKAAYGKIVEVTTSESSKYHNASLMQLAKIDIYGMLDEWKIADANIATDQMITDFNDNTGLPEVLLGIAEESYELAIAPNAPDKKGLLDISQKMIEEEMLTRVTNIEHKTLGYYIACLNSYQLGDPDKAIEYADMVLQTDPNFQYAVNMQWIIADGLEKLKASGQMPIGSADEMIEEEYLEIMLNWPEHDLSGYAAVRLGKLCMSQGRCAEACAYFDSLLADPESRNCWTRHAKKLSEECKRRCGHE